MNKNMMIGVGALVAVVIGYFVFFGGGDDETVAATEGGAKTELTKMLDEYEAKVDEMLALIEEKDATKLAAASTEYGTWYTSWAEKWAEKIKDMDTTELKEFSDRMLKIAAKYTDAMK